MSDLKSFLKNDLPQIEEEGPLVKQPGSDSSLGIYLDEVKGQEIDATLDAVEEYDPKQFVAAQNAGKRYGLTGQDAYHNMNMLEQRKNPLSESVKRAVKESPALANLYLNPEFAAVAKADETLLDKISNVQYSMGRVPTAFTGRFFRSVGETSDALFKTIADAARTVLPTELTEAIDKNLDPFADYLYMPKVFAKGGAQIEQLIPDLPGNKQSFYTDVGRATVEIPMQIAASMLNPALGTAMMFGQGADQQGQRVEELRKQGEDISSARELSARLTGGSVTMLTENFGLGFMKKYLPDNAREKIQSHIGSELLDKIVSKLDSSVQNHIANQLITATASATAEGAQEVVEGIFQELTSRVMLMPDSPVFRTWEEEVKAFQEKMYEGGVAATGSGITNFMMGLAFNRRSAGPVMDNLKAQKLESELGNLSEIAKNSELQKLSPEHFKEIIKAKFGETNLKVSQEGMSELFQSITDEQKADLIEKMPYLEQQGIDADTLGIDLEIPIEDYAAYIAPESYHDIVSRHAKSDFGDKTLNQAEADIQDLTNDIGAELEKELQQMEQDGELEQTAQEAYNHIQEQLLQAGQDLDASQFPPELYRALVTTLSKRGYDTQLISQAIQNIRVRNQLTVQPTQYDTITADITDVLQGNYPKQQDMYGLSVTEWLRKQGVADDGGELLSRDVDKGLKPFQPKMIKEGGRSLDDLALMAEEQGYITKPREEITAEDLLELIDRDLAGDLVFSEKARNEENVLRTEYLEGLDEWIQAKGLAGEKPEVIREALRSEMEDYSSSSVELAQSLGYEGSSKKEAFEWNQAYKKFGQEGMTKEARLERAKAMGFDVDTTYYHGTNKSFGEFKGGNQAAGLIYFDERVGVANDYATGAKSGYTGMQVAEMKTNLEILQDDYPEAFDGKYLKPTVSEDFEGSFIIADNPGLSSELGEILFDSNLSELEQVYDQLGSGEITRSEAIDKYNDFVDTLDSGANVIPVFLRTENTYGTKEQPIDWRELESQGGAQWLKDNGYDSAYATEADGTALVVVEPNQARSINAAFDPEATDSPYLLAQSKPGFRNTQAKINVENDGYQLKITDETDPRIELTLGLHEDDYFAPYLDFLSFEEGDEEGGLGVATTLYLVGLDIAKRSGLGWMSDSILSDASYRMYERLTELGIPFKEDGSGFIIEPQELANIDTRKLYDEYTDRRASGPEFIESPNVLAQNQLVDMEPIIKKFQDFLYADNETLLADGRLTGNYSELKDDFEESITDEEFDVLSNSQWVNSVYVPLNDSDRDTIINQVNNQKWLHGSNDVDIDELRLKTAGEALYLTSDRQSAEFHSQGGKVYETGVGVRNPFFVEESGIMSDAQSNPGVFEEIRALGFDSIVGLDSQEVVVLDEGAMPISKATKSAMELFTRFYQSAFHGTPHEFDEFSTEFMGTGEGAQAYGWGLYFANNREIAEHYRDFLSGEEYKYDLGAAVDDIFMEVGLFPDFNTPEDKVKRKLMDSAFTSIVDLELGYEETIENLKELEVDKAEVDIKNSYLQAFKENEKSIKRIFQRIDAGDGNLYEVELPEDSELINYDKPLSEQPEGVREILEKINLGGTLESVLADKTVEQLVRWTKTVDQNSTYDEWVEEQEEEYGEASADELREMIVDFYESDPDQLEDIQDYLGATKFTKDETGLTMYRKLASNLGSDYLASKYLNDLGIPGLKYLDGDSRSKGEGAYNFVVWDDEVVSVTAVNDQKRNQPKVDAIENRNLNSQQYGESSETTEFYQSTKVVKALKKFSANQKVGDLNNLKEFHPVFHAVVEKQIGSMSEADAKRTRENFENFPGTPWASATVRSLTLKEIFERSVAGIDTSDIDVGGIWGKQDVGKSKMVKAMKAGEEGVKLFAASYSFIGNNRKAEIDFSGSFINCLPSKACATFCYSATGTGGSPSNIQKAEFTEYMAVHYPDLLAKRIATEYAAMPSSYNDLALRMNEKGDLSEPQLKLIKALNDQGLRLQIFSKRPDILRQVPEFNWRSLSVDSTNMQVAYDNPDLDLAVIITDDLPQKFIADVDHRVNVYLPVNLKGKEWSRRDLARMYPGSFSTMKKKICPVDGGRKTTVSGMSYVTVKRDKESGIKNDNWTCTSCDMLGAVGCFNGARKTKTVRQAQEHDLAVNADSNAKEDMIEKATESAIEQLQKLKNLGGITNEQYENLYTAIIGSISDTREQLNKEPEGPVNAEYTQGGEEPYGIGEEVGPTIGEQKVGLMELNQSAYHGTAARGIDNFSTDFMGTGEGAQVYGWGLYFAKDKNIAEWYRETVSRDKSNNKYKINDTEYQSIKRSDLEREGFSEAELSFLDQYSFWGTLDWGHQHFKEAIDAMWDDSDPMVGDKALSYQILGKIQSSDSLTGQLYQVEVPDSDELLDHDLPLSEQPPEVQAKLRKLLKELGIPTIETAFEGQKKEYLKGVAEMGGDVKAVGAAIDKIGKGSMPSFSENYALRAFGFDENNDKHLSTDPFINPLLAKALDTGTLTDYERIKSGIEKLNNRYDSEAWGVIGRNPEPSDPNWIHDVIDEMQYEELGTQIYGRIADKLSDGAATRETAVTNREDGLALFTKKLAEYRANERQLQMPKAKELGDGKFEIEYSQFLNEKYGVPYDSNKDKMTSLVLNSIGIPGLQFLDINSRAGDSPDNKHNFVVWNNDSIAITDAYYQQREDKRGSILIPDNVLKDETVINLFEKSDLSTFLHETGHFFFELQRELAKLGGPMVQEQEITKQWFLSNAASLAKEAGISELKMTRYIMEGKLRNKKEQVAAETAMHEQFARGFESYLSTGKAPSVKLQGAFEQFKAWLMNIYRRLRGLDVNVSDELRGVFDRMLATDQEIEEANQSMNYTDSVSGIEGLTEEEREELIAQSEKATEEAKAQLLKKALREERDKLTKKYKERKAQVKKEVENDVRSRKPYRTQKLIIFGIDPDDNEVNAKLNTKALTDIVGVTAVKQLAKKFGRGKYGITKKDGVNPIQVANMMGYGSVDAMVNDLLQLPKFNETVEAETQQRMQAEYQGPQWRSIDAAIKTAHGNERQKLLETELDVLSIKAGMRSDSSIIMQAAAERKVKSMKVKEIQPYRYKQAEIKASRDVEKALLAKDLVAAREAKTRQLMNFHMYRESEKAKDNVDVGQRYINKFNKPKFRKTVDTEVLEQIDGILFNFEFRTGISQRALEKSKQVAAFVRKQEQAGIGIYLSDSMMVAMENAQREHYKNMSISDFTDTLEAVQSLHHLSDTKNKLKSEQEKRRWEALKDDMITSILSNSKERKAQGMSDTAFKTKLAGMLDASHAYLVTPEMLFRLMDGDTEGIMYNTIFKPLSEAADEAKDWKIEMGKWFNELANKHYTKAELARFSGVGAKRTFIETTGETMSKEEILGVALHFGSHDNRQKLMDGYGINEAQLSGILNKLEKRDWDFVQAMWDKVTSEFWGKTQELEKRVNGVAPEQVVPVPFTNRHGTYQGGYWPLMYRTKDDPQQQKFEDARNVQELLGGQASRATTRQGHTKARVQNTGKKPRIDFHGVLSQHINNVIQDITHREKIIEVFKILTDKEVTDAIVKTFGDDVYKTLKPWMGETVGAGREMTSQWDKFVRHMRTGTSVTTMALSAKTAIQNYAGLFISMTQVPKGALAKNFVQAHAAGLTIGAVETVGWTAKKLGVDEGKVIRAMDRMMRKPWTYVETQKAIVAKSPYLKNRAKVFDHDINQEMKNLSIKGALTPSMGFMFSMIAIIDKAVAVPTWAAAYEDAVESGKSEAQAIVHADSIVRTTQGSGREVDLSAIMADKKAISLFTNFFSYFNAMYNQYWRTGKLQSKAGWGERKMKTLSEMALLIFIPSIFAEWLAGRAPEEEEDYAAWAARTVATYPILSFPIIRDIAIPTYAMYDETAPRYGYKMSPLSMGGESLVKAAGAWGDGEISDSEVRAMFISTGYWMHLPGLQAHRTAEHLTNVATGDSDFSFYDMLYGEKK